ncbi:MAG: hypothetical protein QY326_07330 [Bdellovibrionota bacterium]|nr:MAG: hypothetical protein QY326_07330 [Bdellovibrionota bacterium]
MSDSNERSSIESSMTGAAPALPVSKPRLKTISMDLRIHSPGSLGYLALEGIDTAPALARLAKVKGLDVIAITDYYSADFVERVRPAAAESGITVIPGFVVRCHVGACDDVVLSCLFPEVTPLARLNECLHELAVPAAGRGSETYTLPQPLNEIIETVERYEGRVLPTRMDKTPHRMAAIPLLVENYGFRAFDLAYADSGRFFKLRWPKTKFHLFSFSNAHALAQVGSRYAKVKLQDASFAGIAELISRER